MFTADNFICKSNSDHEILLTESFEIYFHKLERNVSNMIFLTIFFNFTLNYNIIIFLMSLFFNVISKSLKLVFTICSNSRLWATTKNVFNINLIASLHFEIAAYAFQIKIKKSTYYGYFPSGNCVFC